MLNKNLYVVKLLNYYSFEVVITMSLNKINKPFAQLKKIKIWPAGGKYNSKLEYIIVCTEEYVSAINYFWHILHISNEEPINLNDFNNDFDLYFNHF